MSFTVCLNSIDGTQVAGNNNQVTYNFAFDKTPEHKGGYKVTMAFAGTTVQITNNPFINFGKIYVNANLGAYNSYTPIGLYTGTRNNQVLGVINYEPLITANTQYVNSSTSAPNVGTATIPNNADTTGFTKTETTVTPSNGNVFQPIYLYGNAKYSENPPIYLPTKPTNNQFTVSMTQNNGTLVPIFFLYQFPGGGTQHYSLIIHFEAV